MAAKPFAHKMRCKGTKNISHTQARLYFYVIFCPLLAYIRNYYYLCMLNYTVK